ncbi:MAG: hypothetical protein Greene041619_253 [Candidatus Peregrinibacteria bacterium Greene0416_19]|nr:MAG: hypothetical protein Greene041619_253 [Candidatus Peregrinibacteria bacterium Greene0416_19]
MSYAPITIRPATSADIPAVESLLLEHGPNPWNHLPAEEVRAHVEAIATGATRAVLACIGSDVIGAVTYVTGKRYPQYQPQGRSDADHGYVAEAVVHRDHAGKGIGSTLLSATTRSMTAEGIAEVYAMRHEENGASAGMMRKSGFEVVDTFDDPVIRLTGSRRTSVERILLSHPAGPSLRTIDPVRESPKALTLPWLLEHTNMEIALRAYEQGLRTFGRTQVDTESLEGREKMKLVREKIPMHYQYPAILSLSAHQMHEALTLLPIDWLRHARIKTIDVVPTQYFCFGAMSAWSSAWTDEHFIMLAIDGKDAEDHFRGKRLKILEEQALVGPPTRFHYAPGHYNPTKEIIFLPQEPADVMARISQEARQEYGRELVVHEALHSVFYAGSPLEFSIDGVWQDYDVLMARFHAICQEEPAAVTEYSELYAPWMKLPLHADAEEEGRGKHLRVRMALQEELGELLSAYLRGWGATPQGEAKRPADRDFGGREFHRTGISRKLAFVRALVAAPVRVKSQESPSIETVRHETGEQARDAAK